MAEFLEQAKALSRALRNLEIALNKHFPVGTRVIVKWSGGQMMGTIAFPASGGNLKIRSDADYYGGIHHKHYSFVDRA